MKHNLKRLLSLVLALAMCLSMVWVPAFADEEPIVTYGENQSKKQKISLTLRDKDNGSVDLCVGQSVDYEFNTNLCTDVSRHPLSSEAAEDSGNGKSGTITGVAVESGITLWYGGKYWGSARSSTITINVVEHTFEFDHTEEATCTSNKADYEKCSNCDLVKKIEYPGTQLVHSFTNYISNGDATCTEAGTETAQCDNSCGTTDTRATEKDPNNHSFTQYEKSSEATCVNNAKETAQCDRGCGATDTREIPDTATDKHVYGDWYTVEEATEESKGKERRVCINCDAYQERNLRHTKGALLKEEEITAANCSFAGTKEMTYACADEDCEFQIVETVEIPKNDVHLGEPVTTYENINLKEGFYDEVTTYSECQHTVTKQIELDKLEPQVYDKEVHPTVWPVPAGTINVPLHAGQEADFKMVATGLGSLIGVEYTVDFDESVVTLYQDGNEVHDGDKFKFKASADNATPFVVVAKHTMTKASTEITFSFAARAKVKVTVDPHVETPVIANTHPATCTEPGKITEDYFCKFCGYKTRTDSETVIEGTQPLGHLLGNPKWDWVLTRDAEEWAVTAKQICGRENCDYSEDMDVNLDIDSSGNFKVYTATVTDAKGTTYKAVKTQELTYKYSYNGTTVDCYYGQKVVLTADTKSDWFVNGEKVAAGTASYSFRVSKKNAVITTQASAEAKAVTALTTINRIKNSDGSYTAKFTTDWYVPADKKVQSVKTYYRMTNTNQTQATLVAKNQSVTSKLTGNVGTFVANIPVKAVYANYKVYAVSCVTLESGETVWSEVVCNVPVK